MITAKEKATFDAKASQNREAISMQSPPEKTRQKDEMEFQKLKKRLEAEMAETEEILRAIQDTDPATSQNLESFMSKSRAKIRELNRLLELVQGGHLIGSVQAATLDTKDYHKVAARSKLILDVALIPHDKSVLKTDELVTWEVDGLGDPIDSDNHIKVVATRGSNGKYKKGIVSAFKPDIKVKLDNETKMKFSAWAVTNPAFTDDRFCARGDSGSFVVAKSSLEDGGFGNKVPMLGKGSSAWKEQYDREEFIVGLLFGMTDKSDVAFFIPFDAVKTEIESLTGEEMVWPKKRSECMPIWQTAKAE
jgi:hypothetical protein